jgi:alpha-beta hydrolase superfamily lysophospholipase
MLIIILCAVVIVIAALAAMIVFGAGAPPVPLAAISDAFEKADFGTLPPLEILPGRNGAIGFRVWPASPKVMQRELAVIAIHGSSATSHSLHPLAKALSAEGMTVYAPDIRGHGGTGRRGDIDDAGQLDGDLADLAAAVKARQPAAALVLLGFSSGGGFALHIAGSAAGKMFARTVLLSPMLGPYAPTARPGKSPWVTPYIPRIMAITLLNRLGIHAFDHLPALAFGIPPARADLLTAVYSFRLMRAFGALDYAADLKNAASPLAIVAGEKDELFFADKFEPAVKAVRADVPVTIVPGLNHIDIVTDSRAVPAIAAAVRGARA